MKKILLSVAVIGSSISPSNLFAIHPNNIDPIVAQSNIRCYSTKETAKRFGVSEDDFHRIVKPSIIKDYLKSGKKLSCSNPDVCFDGDIIVLRCSDGKTFNTGFNSKNY